MSLTIAIIAPGHMGAAVGKLLNENGVTVLTALSGRSAASINRAREAGIRGVDERQLMDANFLLSIVPPNEALALAQRLAPMLAVANRKPIYVDCNAISPRTMNEIANVVSATGAPFADAGIIGPPPKPGSGNTKFYASGPAACDFARLNEYGLIVRVLEGPLTAASALKMSYAGITKGFTALGAAMMLAATRGGSADVLKAELADSQPALAAWLARQTPAMYAKAYRWAAELDEIAGFVGDNYAEHKMLSTAARLYQRLAADYTGDKREIDVLNRFVTRAAEP